MFEGIIANNNLHDKEICPSMEKLHSSCKDRLSETHLNVITPNTFCWEQQIRDSLFARSVILTVSVILVLDKENVPNYGKAS